MEVIYYLYLVSASLASLHLLGTLIYEILVMRRREFKKFNLILMAGILVSAIDLWFYALVPELVGVKTRASETSFRDNLMHSFRNMLAVIQVGTYASYVYIRTLPIIRLWHRQSLERGMRMFVVLLVILLVISDVLAFTGRLATEPSNDTMVLAGSMTLMAAGTIVIGIDIFYLVAFYRKRGELLQSGILSTIARHTKNCIIVNLTSYLVFLLMNFLPYDFTTYAWLSFTLEILKWLDFLILSFMKISLDRLLNKVNTN